VGALFRDLRITAVRLKRRPGYPLVAVLVLSIGLTAVIGVFAYLSAFRQPFPGADADGLFRLMESDPEEVFRDLSFLDFQDYAATASHFEGVAATQPFFAASVRHEAETEVAFLEAVSGNYFSVLRTPVALGRPIEPSDDAAGAPSVAVISYRWWRRRWDGDPSVIGQTLYLNYRPFTIVGVASPEFLGAASEFRPDVWIPIAPFRDRYTSWDRQAQDRDIPLVRVFARLPGGAPMRQAAHELDGIARGLDEAFPRPDRPRAVRAAPVTWIDPRPRLQESRTNRILALTAAGLLLLVCANVANILLAVFGRRRSGFAMHAALGASPSNLVRQALLEGLILATAGGVLGLALALPLSARLGSYFSRPSVWGETVARQFSLDGTVVLFALGISLATGAVAALPPSIRASSRDLLQTLKSGPTRPIPLRFLGRRAPGVRETLVMAQVALAMVLLTTAGLVIRTLTTVSAIDPGFEYGRLIVSHVSTSSTGVEPEGREAWFEDLALQAASQPWAAGATVSQVAPLSPHPVGRFRIDGRPEPDELVVATVQHGFFDVMGIDVLAGRAFMPGDSAGSPPVAIVNQAAVERFLGGRDAVGRRLWRTGPDGGEQGVEIVGAVGPVRVRSFLQESEPAVYLPYRQATYPTGSALVIRTRGDPESAVATMNAFLREYEPHMAIVNVLAYSQVARGSVYAQRMNAELFSVLAVLGLILSTAGILGVVSLGVVERTKEIGIRRAVGAEAWRVRRMIVLEAVWPVGVGLGLGLGISLGVGLILEGLLLGVEPWDPLTFAGAGALLLAVGVAAASVPAVRAGRLDPIGVLRSD
jgi:putative ABC transport system permease protein